MSRKSPVLRRMDRKIQDMSLYLSKYLPQEKINALVSRYRSQVDAENQLKAAKKREGNSQKS